jgi:Protein of unknown function (DUF1131)
MMLAIALIFSAQSAGPLDSTTLVTRPVLTGLFPGLTIRETTDTVAGEDWATLSVYQGKEELLQISPCDGGPIGKICVVYSRSRSAKTRDGVRVGDSYKKLGKKVGSCSAGFEKDNRKILCESAAARNVMLVFTNPKSEVEGEVPKDLSGFRIEELRWVPPTEP